ncbi:MAG: 1-acyl-sn-glycerol-3-phosphate acyltransferase [Oligoflexus sp.]
MTGSFPFYLPDNPRSHPPVVRFFVKLRGYIFALLIFFPVIIANIFQMLSLVIRPFSPHLFRRFNRLMAYLYWGYLVFMVEKVHRIQVTFTGDEIPKDENALIICNHQNIGDIPALMSLAQRCGRLGDMKWFVKDVIKYVPGPGWGMLFLDCIFLKRNWLSDRAKIEATFHNITAYKVSIWLISFLEGTRITPEKLSRSQKFAQRRNHPVTNYVMLPRTKGFAASVIGLDGHLDAVYSITIGYPDGIPSLWQMVLGDVDRFSLDIVRTPLSELPRTEPELEKWALEAYRQKDAKLKVFHETGRFEGPKIFLQEEEMAVDHAKLQARH